MDYGSLNMSLIQISFVERNQKDWLGRQSIETNDYSVCTGGNYEHGWRRYKCMTKYVLIVIASCNQFPGEIHWTFAISEPMVMSYLRIPGVLQRLAISYGVVALIHIPFAKSHTSDSTV